MHGSPAPAQYRALMELLFGTGDRQKREDLLYHHREPILRALSVALSTRCLDECGEPGVLAFYLTTLLDNQWIMMERALVRLMPPEQFLPIGWFHRNLLFSAVEQEKLAAQMPAPGISREDLKERFWNVVNCCVKPGIGRWNRCPIFTGRQAEVLGALQAITATGESFRRFSVIVFFTLPLAYECSDPNSA